MSVIGPGACTKAPPLPSTPALLGVLLPLTWAFGGPKECLCTLTGAEKVPRIIWTVIV